MKARTTCATSVPQTATPADDAAISQSDDSRSCCSVMRLRSRPTSTRPTMAPAPLALRSQARRCRARPCRRRSPKASRKIWKPCSPADDRHGGQPEQHLGMGHRLQAHQVRSRVHLAVSRRRLVGPGSSDRRPGEAPAAGTRPPRRPTNTNASTHSSAERTAQLPDQRPGHRHHEPGHGAEQRQPRVERGVPACSLRGVGAVMAATSGTSAPRVTR
jgi:hypothetical protein